MTLACAPQLSSLLHGRQKSFCLHLVPAYPQIRWHWCSPGLGASIFDLTAVMSYS